MAIISTAFNIEFGENFRWYFLPICFLAIYPLCLVRKLEAFAKFHIFGDAMVILAIVTCMIYAGITDNQNGGFSAKNLPDGQPDLPWFNTKLWPDAIGFAVYSFEGVGVILPIYEVTANKE